MHTSAMEFGAAFFNTYLRDLKNLKIVDIGAQDVNGSLRTVAQPQHQYIGVDFASGEGVDIVIADAYKLPFESESINVVVCSSCLEHSEFFWLLFNEMLRILRPSGLLYINAPSNGPYHRYPVDCWRFYPDSGLALQRWGNRNGFKVALLESFIGAKKIEPWNDFVAIFVKEKSFISSHRERIIKLFPGSQNGYVNNDPY